MRHEIFLQSSLMFSLLYFSVISSAARGPQSRPQFPKTFPLSGPCVPRPSVRFSMKDRWLDWSHKSAWQNGLRSDWPPGRSCRFNINMKNYVPAIRVSSGKTQEKRYTLSPSVQQNSLWSQQQVILTERSFSLLVSSLFPSSFLFFFFFFHYFTWKEWSCMCYLEYFRSELFVS